MYEQYYGLREKPFNLSPNPRFLFLSRRHREALAHLRYGLTGRPGMTMLIGEAGTGKTTLVRAALGAQDLSATPIVHLSNPTLTRAEFYEYLAAGFGFEPEVGGSKTKLLQRLEALLTSSTGVLAMIVDEAQSLSYELLEEIRLLTNICTPSERALTVVLVGQPELAVRLREPSLRQLRQRISLRCDLKPFDLKETAGYVASRVRIAGANADTLFTRDAIVAIHERSAGIPRTISVICDNALVTGFAADVKPVGRDIVLEVCRDFEFGVSVTDAPAEPVAANGKPSSNGVAVTPAEQVAVARAATVNGNGNGNGNGTGERTMDPRPMFSGFARPRRFSFF